MKLSFNIKGGSVLTTIKKKIGMLLGLFLLVVAILAGLVIYKEWKKISLVRSDTSGITGQIVKVNLNQYQDLETQLNDNINFAPQTIEGSESFGTAPVKP